MPLVTHLQVILTQLVSCPEATGLCISLQWQPVSQNEVMEYTPPLNDVKKPDRLNWMLWTRWREFTPKLLVLVAHPYNLALKLY